MEAFKYEMPEETCATIYHYMVMRYHDMYRDEAQIPSLYKKQAEKLYLILKTIDPLMEQEEGRLD